MKKLLQLSILFFAAFSFGQTPLHRFNFENNLQNTANTVTLTGTNISYSPGRSVAAGNALTVSNSTTVQSFVTGLIPNLPVSVKSVAFWVKLNANSTTHHFYNTGGTSNLSQNGVRFQHNANNERIITGLSDVSGTRAVTYDTDWHLYVINNEGTAGFKVYRDDLLVSTFAPQGGSIGTLFEIGRGQNGNAFAPAGNFTIDEVQIFDFPLTLSQVEGIFYGTPASIVAPTAMLNAISNIGLETVTVNFTMNQNNGATTTAIEYRIGTTGNFTTIAGPNSHGNGQALSQNLTGLTPATTYQYRVVSTNSNGATSSALASFTTLATANMVYHFEFNNSFASSVNTGTLNCTTLPAFTGNGTSANSSANINVPNANGRDAKTLTANLPLMPTGTAARSFAFRVLFNGTTFSTDNQYVFSCGTGSNTQSFDIWSTAANMTVNSWGSGNDKNFATTISTNVWYNYAIIYDGTNITVYRDNAQIGTTQAINANTIATALNIGRSAASNFGQGNFRIDDLKIFTGILTPAQITQLASSTAALSNNDLSSKNLKFSMFPNPTNNLLNIAMAKDLESVEIYSVQGQKVLSGSEKQINVSNLASGMYMVRVQDVDGGVATQKFVKQ